MTFCHFDKIVILTTLLNDKLSVLQLDCSTGLQLLLRLQGFSPAGVPGFRSERSERTYTLA